VVLEEYKNGAWHGDRDLWNTLYTGIANGAVTVRQVFAGYDSTDWTHCMSVCGVNECTVYHSYGNNGNIKRI
jgi:hypothetical protein